VMRPSTAVDRRRITLASGESLPLDARTLLAPLERSLHAMSWGIVLAATALAVARLR
jgi:hypothetical protein